MESLATVMREFGVHISVLEPVPVRTAFFANVGGHVDNISNDDPYAELINRFNRRMAPLGSGGQPAESVADVSARSPPSRHPRCVSSRRRNRGQSLHRSWSTPLARAYWQEPEDLFIPSES
jgi:hypothetical protein